MKGYEKYETRFFGDEFLTTDEEDIFDEPQDAAAMAVQDVPALHKLEEVPTVADQKPIKMGADTKVMNRW